MIAEDEVGGLHRQDGRCLVPGALLLGATYGIYYFVPGLLRQFTSAEINALIAPRPHLSLEGNDDPLTPPAGLDRIDTVLRQVYAEAGAPEAWSLIRYDVGHIETAAMRSEVMAFLARWL